MHRIRTWLTWAPYPKGSWQSLILSTALGVIAVTVVQCAIGFRVGYWLTSVIAVLLGSLIGFWIIRRRRRYGTA